MGVSVIPAGAGFCPSTVVSLEGVPLFEPLPISLASGSRNPPQKPRLQVDVVLSKVLTAEEVRAMSLDPFAARAIDGP